MLDLFGNSVTTPQTVPRAKTDNAAMGFVEFWTIWPSGPRKAAKQQCLNKWASLGCADEAEKIRKHVAWMKTQDCWQEKNGAFIPAPLVYLNQQRWSEWEVVEPKEKPKIDPALAKILADEKKATPMPASVRERLEALKRAG